MSEPALLLSPQVQTRPDGARLSLELKAAEKAISRADPVMRRVIKSVGPCALEVQPGLSCFESLMESIVYQQLTARAAGTIMGRVKALYRNRFPTPAQIIKTDPDKLRSAGLSRAKAIAIQDLADKTVKGALPDIAELARLSDEEIIQSFISVRGIGEWTVQMFLIFRLGRPDVMPCKDYGIRKGFARAFGLDDLPAAGEILSQAECWRPYRSVASWYLWRVPAK